MRAERLKDCTDTSNMIICTPALDPPRCGATLLFEERWQWGKRWKANRNSLSA